MKYYKHISTGNIYEISSDFIQARRLTSKYQRHHDMEWFDLHKHDLKVLTDLYFYIEIEEDEVFLEVL